MMIYGPICGYISIGMYMEVEATYIPWYFEECFEEDVETLVVGGMVFDTLMCGVFDVLDILNNLMVLDQEFGNKTIIGRYSFSIHFHW